VLGEVAVEEEDAEPGAGEDGAGFPLPVPLVLPLPLPLPATHPGTTFAAVAGAGPSVTATHPGRCDNRFPGPTSSSGMGFFAAQEFITESALKRPSFWNTGQSSMTPEEAVHVVTARERTLRSHPLKKSPCSP